ncbi:glycerophosphodiester phosphodiesterase [Comamonas sp. NLF-1-9]|uniref:glycerophosphodiester phosphodiesterase n=1 Tax=Comamonas sp. NLF-1-9 TaxID=2853163 RepID=UPI001C4811BE|nr:glycerophosphodiester phosphodiesterase [Comamonas sp. NLF-1-9]QXL85469.1 glycerophosphodiester phosphodiesterase [Comamonas sp. NLF-1-9]
MPKSELPAWPYPRWIAHRGAGKLAPENTLAAFRLGARHGWRMFECDAKLSSDGVLFLLHDTGLERTTNGQGCAGERSWGELAQLDAGSWHSREFAGEPLPTLERVARWCLANHLQLNIEIKPTPGTEHASGLAVARLAARLWQGQATGPLLTSFQPAALAGAREGAPELARGLLLDEARPDALELAREHACVALVCNHRLWHADSVAAAHAAGLRALSYTVNDEETAGRLWQLGVDGIISDRVELFSPAG